MGTLECTYNEGFEPANQRNTSDLATDGGDRKIT